MTAQRQDDLRHIPAGLAELLSPRGAPGGVTRAHIELYDGEGDYAGFAACRVAAGEWRIEFHDEAGRRVGGTSGAWSPPHLAVEEYLRVSLDGGRVGVAHINMPDVPAPEPAPEPDPPALLP
ncbi:hypothetical protein F5972_08500 [Microbispora cellulosiformans]|uniref:Uncharacterized protein n=1 Tax=Microbispora cellulosiformans TaxID=2614688 RepID=A0A5J5K5D3_9ACTN|nr:hypothetical protein [Microbispora cellulosiformans]KAA9379682.1 hypothetical protein F5972_08500 [Microbispora cellulosiformans]